MFSVDSRYRPVPEVPTRDARGRLLLAVDFRPLPAVTGTFRHLVAAGDRLDQVAAAYYGRPGDWWHICDANPAFLSPLALLGADAVVTTSFPLRDGTAAGTGPPWARLLRRLGELGGVHAVRIVDDVDLHPREQVVEGRRVVVVEEVPVRVLEVTHNRVEAAAELIADTIRGEAVDTGAPVELGQLGAEIVIPPRAGG